MKLHQKLYQYILIFSLKSRGSSVSEKIPIFGPKTGKHSMNKKPWILIKLQCVVYQWIRLDKLYKQMESFSKIKILF